MTASDLFKNSSLGPRDNSAPKPHKKHARAFSVVENPRTFKDFEKWSPTPEPKEVKQGPKEVPYPESDTDVSENRETRRKPSIIPYYDDDNPDINTVFSQTLNNVNSPLGTRRSSVDESTIRPKKFFINDIDYTLKELLENEDTDNNFQITTDDAGPKMLMLGTVNSNGYRKEPIRGTYMLSNLLQELTIARRFGMNQMILDEARLNENPVERLKRLISEKFWNNLTREISKDNIVEMARDSKIVEETTDENGNIVRNKESHRIYIPYNRKDQYDYFNSIKVANPSISLQVEYLPKKIDAEYVKSINKKPGLLALSARPDPEHPGSLIHEPYVVPGGRFNELYGWDSYMETLGLLSDVTKTANHQHLRLARGMTENFIYEIDHYGKILNANRSYYLGRSQPPFLTDMTLRVFDKTNEVFPEKAEETHDFLRRATEAAIKEYFNIWFAEPRLDPETQLSCYHPEGDGIPPETESTHFESILGPYLEKHNLTQEEFIEKYNSKEIREPALDEYFLHDRAVRESGHDTSYRLEGVCAHLATVDLNSLLYKYEIDIAQIITDHFGGKFTTCSGDTYEPEEWLTRAKNRQQAITKYLWSEKDSMFYDYNVKTKKQTKYVSATAFWPLWAKVATPEQARKLVVNSTQKLEEYGGLVSGTLASRGEVNLMRPSRQWDYPFGWAPHQMLAWIGLANYGYRDVATRLAYRWLYMMIKQFVDYNGVVVEKYNVTKGAVSHKVDAEYGNQGLDFKGVVTEGFGWVNASFMLGITFMDLHGLRCLGTVTPPELYIKSLKKGAKAENLE